MKNLITIQFLLLLEKFCFIWAKILGWNNIKWRLIFYSQDRYSDGDDKWSTIMILIDFDRASYWENKFEKYTLVENIINDILWKDWFKWLECC